MKRARQYIRILAAAAAYYSVHEEAHLLCAVLLGTFKQIRFMGIGMQIDVYAERMTDGQMALFYIAGATATLFVGIVLAALAGKISRKKSKLFRAVMYYITIALLLLDPLYLRGYPKNCVNLRMFSSSMKYSKRRRKIQHLSAPRMSSTARRTCKGSA